MEEIVTARQVDTLFLALAITGPVVGAVVSWARRRGILNGLLWGLLPTANWLLWRLYNAITDRLGLDTVKNLLVNLALFLVIGAVVGGIAALWTRRGAFSDADRASRH